MKLSHLAIAALSALTLFSATPARAEDATTLVKDAEMQVMKMYAQVGAVHMYHQYLIKEDYKGACNAIKAAMRYNTLWPRLYDADKEKVCKLAAQSKP